MVSKDLSCTIVLGNMCLLSDKFIDSITKHDLILMALFASLKKQAETLFRLICCERKTLFRLKKQAEKYGL